MKGDVQGFERWHGVLDLSHLFGQTLGQGDSAATDDYPGLVRAADLIGQLADINYARKMPALFAEFKETGMAEKLGYRSAAELRAGFPGFFKNVVTPYIGDALRYLRVTQEGKEWIARLYAHAFAEEQQNALLR